MIFGNLGRDGNHPVEVRRRRFEQTAARAAVGTSVIGRLVDHEIAVGEPAVKVILNEI